MSHVTDLLPRKLRRRFLLSKPLLWCLLSMLTMGACNGEAPQDDQQGNEEPANLSRFDGPGGVHVELRASAPTTWNQLDVYPVYQPARWVADHLASTPYEFALSDDVALREARITIPFRDELLGDVDPSALRIYHYDETYGLWVDAGPDQTIDLENRTVSVTVNHFSTFAVLRLPETGFASYWDLASVRARAASPCTTTIDPAVVPVNIVVIPQGFSAADNFETAVRSLFLTDHWQTTFFAPGPGGLASWTPAFPSLAPASYHPSGPPGQDFLSAVDAAFQGQSLLQNVERSIAALESRDAGTRIVIANVHNIRENGLTPEEVAALGDLADRAARAGIFFVLYYRDPDRPSSGSDPLVRALSQLFFDREDSDFFFGSRVGGSRPIQWIVPGSDSSTLSERLPRNWSLAGGEAAAMDSDGDGLSDCEERGGMYVTDGFYRQNPLIPDSIFRPRPRIYRTNPEEADSDGDGLTDDVEMGLPLDLNADSAVAAAYRFLIEEGVTRVYNPISDPNDRNSDRDGLSDFEEFEAGTNAFEEDTDQDGVWDDDEITARQNGLDLDPAIHDGNLGGIPGLRPDKLFVPEAFSEFQWPAGTILYRSDFRCSEGGGQDTDSDDCRQIVNYSRNIFVNSGRYDSFFGLVNVYCHTLGGCDPTDIESELIASAVASQGHFNPNGSLRDSIVREQLLIACYEQANNGELCSLEIFQEMSIDPVESTEEYAQLVLDVLSSLPGGLRPDDDEIDQVKDRLEQLCREAKMNIPRTTQTAQVWGNELHREFERLIMRDGNPRLFGETGYLDGTIANRRGAAWPGGTTAPDAVLGPNVDMPKAIFDLKTGIRGIGEVWESRVRRNVPDGFRDIPVIEIRC